MGLLAQVAAVFVVFALIYCVWDVTSRGLVYLRAERSYNESRIDAWSAVGNVFTDVNKLWQVCGALASVSVTSSYVFFVYCACCCRWLRDSEPMLSRRFRQKYEEKIRGIQAQWPYIFFCLSLLLGGLLLVVINRVIGWFTALLIFVFVVVLCWGQRPNTDVGLPMFVRPRPIPSRFSCRMVGMVGTLLFLFFLLGVFIGWLCRTYLTWENSY